MNEEDRIEILFRLRKAGIRFPITRISQDLNITRSMVSMWFSGVRNSPKIENHIKKLLREKVNKKELKTQ